METAPGTGIWASARRLGPAVRHVDPDSGEVGLGLRLKIDGRAVSESEWIIAREGMSLYRPEGFIAALPRARRPAGMDAPDRATAIRIANSYFEGIDESLTGARSGGINRCTEGFERVRDRTEDVIDRRFFYDSEAGVVWGHGIFSRVPNAMQGREPLKWLHFFELFEIDDGRIRGIYAAMDYLPTEITGSGWGGATE